MGNRFTQNMLGTPKEITLECGSNSRNEVLAMASL
jgi:hypothetical protein